MCFPAGEKSATLLDNTVVVGPPASMARAMMAVRQTRGDEDDSEYTASRFDEEETEPIIEKVVVGGSKAPKVTQPMMTEASKTRRHLPSAAGNEASAPPPPPMRHQRKGSTSPPRVGGFESGELVWAKLRGWGWWPGKVAYLSDFRPNKRKHQEIIKGIPLAMRKGGAEEGGHVLVLYYGDSTWSWNSREKVTPRCASSEGSEGG